MNGCLNAIIRIFLCLLNHDVGAKILLFRPLIIIMPICSRLPIGTAAIARAVAPGTRILSRVCSFILDVDELRRHTLQLLPIGRRCLLLVLNHAWHVVHRVCVS
jgi:hypothetical protein